MLVGVYVIYYIAQYALNAFFRYSALAVLISLVFTIISLILQVGSVNLALRLLDGKDAKIQDLYYYPNMAMKILKTFLASIAFGLMVVGGLILLVVPGIYLAIRFMFFGYYIVDKDAGIVDSLKMSWNLTQGAVLNLFLFALLIIGLNILGAIPFGLGLLITAPLTLIAVSKVYRSHQS